MPKCGESLNLIPPNIFIYNFPFLREEGVFMILRIPKEKIIEKIKEKTGLSDKEISKRIKDKMDLLSGLISEEGAAHILANELGVKIFEDAGKLQIKNVLPGMKTVEIAGKVIKIYETRTFDKNNRKGKVASFLIGDETGLIRIVAWNDKVDILSNMKETDAIKIENGYAKENNGRIEVHLGDKSKTTITPGDGSSIKVKESTKERKKIKDLNENEENVEILGTILQVFDPKFFEVCPECNKRVKQREDGFFCEQHNIVNPLYSYVLNLLLDDGSDNVRIVLWRNQVQKLFNMNDQEILEKKTTGFEDMKNELLGKIVKFVGRTNKNQMFERIEFTPQLVFTNPNPEEEIERLNKEIAGAKEESDEQTELKSEVIESSEEEYVDDVEEDVEVEKVDIVKKDIPEKKKDTDLLEEIDDLSDLDNL